MPHLVPLPKVLCMLHDAAIMMFFAYGHRLRVSEL